MRNRFFSVWLTCCGCRFNVELLAQKRSIFDAIQKNFKLCCNHDGQSVLQNRNATMMYEGGCQNVVHLKAKLDPIRRGFLGVFCLHEKKRWNSIAKFSSDFH
jgi:hypothetical protein